MLRKKLYVLISKPLVPPEQLKPPLATHLDYMIGLEKRGLLFASGPLNEADAPPSGHGLTILRVKDAAEARRIAEAEPFFAQGLRTRAQGVDSDGGHAWCARQPIGSKRRSGVAGEDFQSKRNNESCCLPRPGRARAPERGLKVEAGERSEPGGGNPF